MLHQGILAPAMLHQEILVRGHGLRQNRVFPFLSRKSQELNLNSLMIVLVRDGNMRLRWQMGLHGITLYRLPLQIDSGFQ